MQSLSFPAPAKPYILADLHHKLQKQILFCTINEESAKALVKQINIFDPKLNILHIPVLDALPYDRSSSNITITCNRVRNLIEAGSNSANIIITSTPNFISKLPPRQLLANSCINLKIDNSLNIKELSQNLIEIGFIRSSLANEPGEFAIRGEIIDIAGSDNIGYRICGAFGIIDNIKLFDLDTQLSYSSTENTTIYPASEVLFTEETYNNFRKYYIQHFGVNSNQTDIMEQIIAGRRLGYLEQLMPLFYEEYNNITDYIAEDAVIIMDNLYEQAISGHSSTIEDFYNTRLETNNDKLAEFYPALPTAIKYFTQEEIQQFLPANAMSVIYDNDHNEIGQIESFYQKSLQAQQPSIMLLTDYAHNNRKHHIIVTASTSTGIERLKMMLEQQNIIHNELNELQDAKKNVINLLQAPFTTGFSTKTHIFITEQDLFGDKISTTPRPKARKQLKNLLAELNNFTIGEKVTHKKHGIAQFAGIETVTASNHQRDCIKLIFAGNDKLFIPVENIEQITRYGENDVALDKLGGVSWQKRHAKLKERIGAMAQKLIAIAAARELKNNQHVEIDLAKYDKFCDAFPFVETEDQLTTEAAIKEDILTGKLLDRLVCGDVGFGKTEIAMRAAFLISAAPIHKKQTVVISPTTILCRQHYNSFVERFKNTGMRIAQISRLVPPSRIAKIKEDIAHGLVDIVIGTHAVLSKDIHFSDLGLVVIDEEQHFGVAQKEKLKELKQDIHVLAMSATPIPRSLQMSLVGIRDLSLITTPPVDRLSVRTHVSIYDPITIREALMREHYRGGQSFFVCPRIADLEGIEMQLKEFAPELSYRIAHGRMPPSHLDEIMSEFDEGKFDILLSTTIIESGIDVPAANTMIIYRADMLGLSQLYQLRGRVGRSKVRGQAYITLNNKHASDTSRKRLEILQNLDGLGAGFAIASHDMDLRGFGNIVGDEQSGQIKEVGVELYHDMLEEAINGLKCAGHTENDDEFTPDLNLGISVLIPASYIEDGDLRLAFYRKLAAVANESEIATIRSEMADRFGPIPDEVANLTHIISLKLQCKQLKIEQVDSGPHALAFTFHQTDDITGQMIMFIIKTYPRITKLKPDGKLIILHSKTKTNTMFELNRWLEIFQETKAKIAIQTN